jgi:hypothetical protein
MAFWGFVLLMLCLGAFILVVQSKDDGYTP